MMGASGATSKVGKRWEARLANKRLGLLINFNVVLIRDGITRLVNGLEE
jgi:hypothetical protein